MGIILWLIIGGVIGWIASMIMRTDAQQGIFLNIIVGIVGAFIGGFLAGLLGLNPDGFNSFFNLRSWLFAIVGACVLIFLVGLVTGRRRV